MIKKEIGFTVELKIAIQEYADINCDGNFNMAVRQLIRSGLA